MLESNDGSDVASILSHQDSDHGLGVRLLFYTEHVLKAFTYKLNSIQLIWSYCSFVCQRFSPEHNMNHPLLCRKIVENAWKVVR